MNMKMIATSLPLLVVLSAASGVALAREAGQSREDSDTRAMVQEERDRLAREKREMLEREALLQKQLKTHERLLKEQDAQLEELKRQVRELKSGA